MLLYIVLTTNGSELVPFVFATESDANRFELALLKQKPELYEDSIVIDTTRDFDTLQDSFDILGLTS